MSLKSDKRLADLVTFSATPRWRTNSVTATNGADTVTTDPAEWWSNSIVVDNVGGMLTAPDTIYLVTERPANQYQIRGAGSALVVAPLLTMNGNQNQVGLVEVYAHRVWLEGIFDATGHDPGIYGFRANLLNLRSLAVANSDIGRGVWLEEAHGVVGYDLRLTNNGDSGITTSNSNHGRFRNVVAAGNGTDIGSPLIEGIAIYGSGNRFEDVTVTNDSLAVGRSGILAVDNVLRRVTITGGQLYLRSARHTRISDLTIDANGLTGEYLLYALEAYGSVIHNAAVKGGGGGVPVRAAVYLSGGVVATQLAAYDADGNGGDLRGSNVLLGATVSGPRGEGLSLEDGSTVMGALVRDASNLVVPADGRGIRIVGADSTIRNIGATATSGHAISLESTAQATNLSGSVWGDAFATDCFASTTVPDRPFNNSCAIDATYSSATAYEGFLDRGVRLPPNYELSATSPMIDAGVLPTGNDTVTHAFSYIDPADSADCDGRVMRGASLNAATTKCEITFLRDAFEQLGDGIGNDNGVCESDETCVFMPNIGKYQGHGALVPAATIGAGGAIENVTLVRFETNGL